MTNTKRTVHERGFLYLLKDQVNGASSVDIDKVYRGFGVEEFSTAGHSVGMRPTHLHTKHIFTFMALQ